MASKLFKPGTTIDSPWLNDVNSITYGLPQSSGAGLVGFIQNAIGAVATTIAEIFSRTVSVWDFMSPALRTDALSGNPVLDHAPAWNAAIVSLGGAGRLMVPRKKTAVYLMKTTVNVNAQNSTAFDSSVVIDIEPGVIVRATLPNITDVLFSCKNVPGHFNNQGIKNLHAVSTNGNGVCIKLNGQCFGGFENTYIEGFNVGRWISNEGSQVYNEFIRFQNTELHLNNTATLMSKDGDAGGTDTSMHGIVDRNCTINMGAGQVGFQLIDVCWYNADFDLKFFSKSNSGPIIKMSTNGDTTNKGVFGSGSVTCEGPAQLSGVGRFYFPTGFVNFDVGVTDTLVAPNSWEQGFMCANYIKSVQYGPNSGGLMVAEIAPKSGEYGTIGPVGSFARLRRTGVEGLVANCYDSHTATPGNMFYTGYTGYQKNYNSANLGHGLSSDGSEFTTFVPTSSQCRFTHNSQYIIRFDGLARPNSTEGFLIGSHGAGVYAGIGSPEGVVTASPGSTYQRVDQAGASIQLYVKETGTGNVGWISK